MALQPMLARMTYDIFEPTQQICVTNRHGQKFNFQCCEMDGQKKKSMGKCEEEKVQGRKIQIK